MTMKAEINIEEVRNKSIHEDLFKVLCLLKQSRNIIHEIKTKDELQDHYERLDHIQTDLNDETAWIGEMIGDVMSCRVDDLV